VYRTKRRFVEGNLERALTRIPVLGRSASSPARKSLVVATALRKPPEGRAAGRWMLADAMVKLTGHESLSGETVRRRLAEKR